MSELTPQAAALVRAGRAAFRPQAADRERVLQALTNTLGPGALGSPLHAGLAKSAAAGFGLRAWIVGGVGVLTVGAAVLVAPRLWTRPSPSAAPAPAALPSASLVAAPEPPANLPASSGDDAKTAGTESVPSPHRPAAVRSSASRPADSLPEEVRLLSRAEQQLNAGHADDALRTLGEHERRFPDGALAEERLAARVQSLCALGRLTDARADLAKLARAYPRSPYSERARRYCGIDVTAP